MGFETASKDEDQSKKENITSQEYKKPKFELNSAGDASAYEMYKTKERMLEDFSTLLGKMNNSAEKMISGGPESFLAKGDEVTLQANEEVLRQSVDAINEASKHVALAPEEKNKLNQEIWDTRNKLDMKLKGFEKTYKIEDSVKDNAEKIKDEFKKMDKTLGEYQRGLTD